MHSFDSLLGKPTRGSSVYICSSTFAFSIMLAWGIIKNIYCVFGAGNLRSFLSYWQFCFFFVFHSWTRRYLMLWPYYMNEVLINPSGQFQPFIRLVIKMSKLRNIVFYLNCILIFLLYLSQWSVILLVIGFKLPMCSLLKELKHVC